MATYSAYFDESGHPDDSDVLVVAGALADVDQWVHLEREWKDALSPLSTRTFHATDFAMGNKPFDCLTETEKDELFGKLTGILCRRIEKSCAWSITLRHYKVANEKYALAEQFGYPYPAAARLCMGGVEEWAHTHSVDVHDILCFFEDGAKDRGQIEWIAQRDGLPIPHFKKKAGVIALQAADLLAWLIHLHLADHNPISRYAKGIERLLHISYCWGEMDFSDPDRLPTILGIQLRDHQYKYEPKVVKAGGGKPY